MNPAGRSYYTVDLVKLRTDVMRYCSLHGLVMSKILMINGISDSLFSNAKNTYLRNMADVDATFCTEQAEQAGRVLQVYYEKILSLFELKDIYKIPVRTSKGVATVKKPVVSSTVETSNAEIAEQLKNIEMSINRLGNVMMQILEKMPAKTIEKPMAKLPDKK